MESQRGGQAFPGVQLPEGAEILADFGASPPAAWLQDGSSFEHVATGAVVPAVGASDRQADQRPDMVADVIQRGAVRRRPGFPNLTLKPGTQTDPGRTSSWNRPGRTFRTDNFTIAPGTVYYLVEGEGRTYAAVDSHRLNEGPLHGSFIKQWKAENGPQWIAHNLAPYAGHRAHLEFTAIDDKPLAVYMVVQAASAPTLKPAGAHPVYERWFAAADNDALAKQATELQQQCLAVLDHWSQGQVALPGDEGAAASRSVAQWMLRHPELFVETLSAELAAARQRFLAARAEQLAQIKVQSATAPALWEGFAEDEEFLVRGNHKTPGGRVPRRYLEAFGGKENPATGPGSGRLQLAEHLVDPARNPAVARVIVNRVWHHLWGRGIVASTDNFGVLGNEPTHPELLDYLAVEFVADGWSIKRLIRRLVLTSTFAMDSTPQPAANERDPQNLLLHRMPIRRLEAEAIRDAILAVSGRLEPQMFGPSVPVYLTPFMQGRGRPGQSGPLDGNGRRSIYIAIRRNFLLPMMLAFDQPIPFTSMGRRNTSNVPAQALILMNDPFVVQQAQVWAQRLLAEAKDPTSRVERMYRLAFARAPRSDEQAAALEFLAQQGQELGLSPQQALNDARAWADLCHVMFNVKEFVFIP